MNTPSNLAVPGEFTVVEKEALYKAIYLRRDVREHFLPTPIPETDVYSTCCAIQNLWLAARVEGIGVGWVSILDYTELRRLLGIPPHVISVAYLCIGYVDEFLPQPQLERVGWLPRAPLEDVISYERWGKGHADQ